MLGCWNNVLHVMCLAGEGVAKVPATCSFGAARRGRAKVEARLVRRVQGDGPTEPEEP